MNVVLDATALLALLQQEPGSQPVARALGDSAISVADLAEVATKQADLGLDASLLVARVEALSIRPFAVTRVDVATQARIRRLDDGCRLGLSLSDRRCLALGLHLEVPVITTDNVWAELDLPIEVVLIC